jgi:hypothetical protein
MELALVLPRSAGVTSSAATRDEGIGAKSQRWRVDGTRPRFSVSGGINTLPFLVAALTMKDMKTAREQKEASTVEANTGRLETRLWRHYPCSLPSRAIVSTGLGISDAFGIGQVPV